MNAVGGAGSVQVRNNMGAEECEDALDVRVELYSQQSHFRSDTLYGDESLGHFVMLDAFLSSFSTEVQYVNKLIGLTLSGSSGYYLYPPKSRLKLNISP